MKRLEALADVRRIKDRVEFLFHSQDADTILYRTICKLEQELTHPEPSQRSVENKKLQSLVDQQGKVIERMSQRCQELSRCNADRQQVIDEAMETNQKLTAHVNNQAGIISGLTKGNAQLRENLSLLQHDNTTLHEKLEKLASGVPKESAIWTSVDSEWHISELWKRLRAVERVVQAKESEAVTSFSKPTGEADGKAS